MSDEAYAAMLDEMRPNPLEFRIAVILLRGANADGELSEEELDGISEVTVIPIGIVVGRGRG
jgi:hypothetical protein